MAIQVGGTTVIDNSRNVVNVNLPGGNMVLLSSNSLAGASSTSHIFTGLTAGGTSSTNPYMSYKLILSDFGGGPVALGYLTSIGGAALGITMKEWTKYNIGSEFNTSNYFMYQTNTAKTTYEVDILIDGFDFVTYGYYMTVTMYPRFYNHVPTSNYATYNYLVQTVQMPVYTSVGDSIGGVKIFANTGTFVSGTSNLYGVLP